MANDKDNISCNTFTSVHYHDWYSNNFCRFSKKKEAKICTNSMVTHRTWHVYELGISGMRTNLEHDWEFWLEALDISILDCEEFYHAKCDLVFRGTILCSGFKIAGEDRNFASGKRYRVIWRTLNKKKKTNYSYERLFLHFSTNLAHSNGG